MHWDEDRRPKQMPLSEMRSVISNAYRSSDLSQVNAVGTYGGAILLLPLRSRLLSLIESLVEE
jgi:hypothetical protein